MRLLFRIVAAAMLVSALVFWVSTGASPGWTQTQVEIRTVDPVTGVVSREWKPTFVPGLDFVAAAALVAAASAGASFFFRKKSRKRIGKGKGIG